MSMFFQCCHGFICSTEVESRQMMLPSYRMNMPGSLKVCKNQCQMIMIPTASWVTHVRQTWLYVAKSDGFSVTWWSFKRGNSRKYSKSRAFCSISETICWISEGTVPTLNDNKVTQSYLDPNARSSCCGWNPFIILATLERHNLYWKTAVTVCI